ncbi:MAG: AMP-binding protein [Rhodopseudomonas sp.]|uniref:AMP-binding protein n=1 Tax=Rhodopseudomonas sp. TaxID=1078 RepID=UPI00180D999A|nr:AMP-binding protein [Rhodopseudomonas sp.]NVN85049.1 AMP-binding protein [Rhodopseudomonas sp.]
MASGANIEPDATLSGRIVAALRAHGAATVVRWKRYGLWQPVSGDEMATRIEAIGNGLRARGLAAGDVAAVIGDNCHEWVLADLGIVAAGGVSAGLDAHSDSDELARTLNQCGARFLFVAGDDQLHKALQVRDRCPALATIVVMHQQWDDGAGEAHVIALQALETRPAAAPAPRPAPLADAPAVIIYSAGVTGPARGAILTHKAVGLQAARAAAELGLGPDDERLSLTPIHFVLERVVGIYAALLSGTVINFSESPDTALANLVELKPTVIQASPQLYARLRSGILLNLADTTPLQRWACRTAFALAQYGDDAPVWQRGLRVLFDRLVLAPIRRRIGFGRARLCLSSGAVAHPDVVAWFAALGCELVDIYGHAETGGASRIATSQPRATPDVVEIKLGEHGEVWLRGAPLFTGYAGEAPAALAEGWWRSGDLGRHDDRGQLRVVGRLADILHKDQGSLLPFDSEQALRSSPYIADAFLHLDAGGRICARVLLDSDNTVKFAQDRSVPFTHFQSLCKADEIRALVEQLIAEVNRARPAVRIESFSLIERALKPGDAEVAPTLTLRRYLLRAGAGAAGSVSGEQRELLKT